MGTPAVPTEAERAATLELARRIVEAVRNDEPSPLELANAEMMLAWAERVDLASFRLAQDLTLVTAERDEALKQSRLGWERAAENDRAYAGALKERDAMRADLKRIREAWNDDQGLRADRRFVDAVCALLDQEPRA